MDAQRREYDGFGPWAIEIQGEEPPPPLFVPYLTRPDPALLSIKIPRLIERRDACPGMDLYDYIVCLYAEDLVVHERVGHEVRSATCPYRDVQHVRVARHLLSGNVQLGVPGRPWDLPYNTVSDGLMSRLVDLIRARYGRPACHPLPGRELKVGAGELSFYFERLLAAEQRHDPGMRLLVAQPTAPVGSDGMTAVRRLLVHVSSKRLLESMHLSDGRELMIIDRGQPYAYRWQAIYGSDTWYIPVANLRRADWQEDATNAAIDLTLGTGGGTSSHVFAQDNPWVESYAAFLSALLEEAPDTMAA